MKKNKIAIIGALSDDKFRSKVEPLIALEEVEKVYLYRRTTNPVDEKYASKIVYKKSSLPKPLFYISSFLSIIALGISGKINLIVGIYFFPYGIIAGIAGRLTRKPVIQILPGSDLNRITNEKKFVGLLSKSYKIGARGNNSLKALIKLGIPEKKLFVLQNAFELPSKPKSDAKKKWDVIFIGYLRKPKRIDVTIEVIQKLKLDFPNIRCVIVGDGPEFENIKKEIDKKNLTENITLAGHQNHVDEYLSQSGIFLLTSESEGLPMVLVEALSHGIPVVTSDINDISDLVINGKNGFLIPSLQRDDYFYALKNLLEDKVLYNELSQNAKATIKDFHEKTSSFEAVQNKWKEVLEN